MRDNEITDSVEKAPGVNLLEIIQAKVREITIADKKEKNKMFIAKLNWSIDTVNQSSTALWTVSKERNMLNTK